ncbi:MAG: hypothetical protein M3R24_23875 [Chloroflexota bacterium]|nr:hypothetical protein [Chloroflexota bacterium]
MLDDVEITPEMEDGLKKAYRYLLERRQKRLDQKEKPAQLQALPQGDMEFTTMQP